MSDKLRVAFSGERDAFSEEAVLALWPHADPLPARAMTDVAQIVSSGEADAGVLPVENTVAGSVLPALNALVNAPVVHVVAETILRIRQCLIAPVGATLEQIEVVESHPVALAQCALFLSGLPHIIEQAVSNTAVAARSVAEHNDPRRAAIASARAAARYGLAILADHIEDRHDNQTRFLAIARTPVTLKPAAAARTSLIFTTANEPGRLLRALEALAAHELNLSRLESQPTGEPWTYRFFADIDHVAGHPRLDAAVGELAKATLTCRVLGTYARAVS
jgi:prephenate dehydratase